jgi:hypothetical protein
MRATSVVTAATQGRDDEKQNTESRIQEPEEKRTESVNVASALYSDFWILNSVFYSLPPGS